MKYKTSWDLSKLLQSSSHFNEIEYEKQMINAFDEFREKWNDNSFLDSPSMLLDALNQYEDIIRNYIYAGILGFYYHLALYKDQLNSNNKQKIQYIDDLYLNLINKIQFFNINLGKIDKNKQNEFLKSPLLKKYQYFLKRIFELSKYDLTEEQEKVFNLNIIPAKENWIKLTASILSKEELEIINEKHKKIKIHLSETAKYIDSKDPKVRKITANAESEIFIKYLDVAEAEMNSILLHKMNEDKLRKCNFPEEYRFQLDDVDQDIIENMIDSVLQSNSISHEFYKLKGRLLNIDSFDYYEKTLKYGNIEKKYNFEQAVEIVDKVFYKLNPEFSCILKNFLNDGRIDVFPSKGKTGMCFCSSGCLKVETHILLNHNDKLQDVLTLAHELGHAINFYYSRITQDPLYSDMSLATAEIASTFIEDFVLEEIKNDCDEETRLALNMMKIEEDISTIHRQTACFVFEKDLHNKFRKKGAISKDEISLLFEKNMMNYLGSQFKFSENMKYWWVNWPHIRDFFYVYSYVLGLLISKIMQKMVKDDSKNISNVIKFFENGSSLSPYESLKSVGIDIKDKEIWNTSLLETRNLINETFLLAKSLKKF